MYFIFIILFYSHDFPSGNIRSIIFIIVFLFFQLKIENLNGSSLLSYLAMELKPRYHFSGLEGVHYGRPPYRIYNNHGEKSEVATRFISLARVGNPEKQKWLYAASLTPVDKTKLSDLLQPTTDETQCPYDSNILRNIGKKEENVQYFYNMNAPDEEKRKHTDKDRQRKRQKMEFDQSKCWFCLSSPEVEKHLVVSVGNVAYLALAKGGLVDEHLLIIPTEHHQSVLALPNDVLNEIQQFKEALTNFFEKQEKVPIFFERNYKTSHCQINVVPIPVAATREIADIFKVSYTSYAL